MIQIFSEDIAYYICIVNNCIYMIISEISIYQKNDIMHKIYGNLSKGNNTSLYLTFVCIYFELSFLITQLLPCRSLGCDLKNIFSMQISLGNGVELYLHVYSSLAGSSGSFGSRTGASGAPPPYL